MLQKNSLVFLEDLASNNDREWFQANKERFENAKSDLEKLVTNLITEVGQFQELGNLATKDCMFRIYRDVRFSKNKLPYKLHMAATIGPGGRKSNKIDYYLHIQPNNQSFIGGGMWEPTAEQLTKFRQELDYNAQELKDIINDPEFLKFYPTVLGEVLKTTPKGYAKDHPEIELLRRKQMFFIHNFTDTEVTSVNFASEIVKGIRLLKPYTDFLNYLFFEEENDEPFLL